MKKNIFFRTALALAALLAAHGGRLAAATLDSSTIHWTGTAGSDWGDSANWSSGALPGATDYIGIGFGSPENIYITNTNAGNLTYTIGGLSVTPGTGEYNINLQGTAGGMAILDVAGGGFYSVNNANTDLPVTITLNDYSKLVYSGARDATAYPEIKNAPDRSSLWGAAIVMHGNSIVDLSAASTTSSILVASLDMDSGATVTTGTNLVYLSYGSNISGAFTSSRASGEALRLNTFNASQTTVIGQTGVVTLAGSSYALLRYGTLQVDGVFNGNIRQQAGATTYIGGSGYIIGLVTSNSTSVIAPGTSIDAGTLSITGTLSMTPKTSINFDFFTETSRDQLVVNGQLELSEDLEGVTLGVSRDMRNFAVRDGARYKLITVNGELTGGFNDKLIHNFGMIASESFWEAIPLSGGGGYEIWIQIVRGKYADVAGITENQRLVAGAIDRLGDALPHAVGVGLDGQYSVSAYGNVLDQLGPQSYQVWFPAAVTQASALASSVENRLAIPDEKLRAVKKFDIYAQASRSTGYKNATDYNEYYEIDPIRIMTGIDYAVTPAFLAGLVYAYDKTDYTMDDSGSTGDSKSHTFGAYARYRAGNFQASLLGYYGTDDYNAKRGVSQIALNGTHLDGSTDGTRYGARVLVSYKMPYTWLDIRPTAGLQYIKWKADGFAESGAAGEAALTVAKQDAESLITTTGLQLARSYEILKGKAVIRPFLNAYLQFEARYKTREITANVLGETVTVKAAKPNRTGWQIEGGVSLDYYSGLSLFASFGNESTITLDQTVALRVGAGYRF